jgi:hypothetical protein
VYDPSSSEVSIAITKLKSYKSVGSNEIPAEYQIISLCFKIIDQLLIRFFALVRYRRKNWSTIRQYISTHYY